MMAKKPNMQVPNGSLMIAEESRAVLEALRQSAEKLPMSGSDRGDAASQLGEIVSSARERRMRVDGITIDRLEAFKTENEILNRAKQLIREGKYQEALDVLSGLPEALGVSMEAVYLAAVCHCRLGDSWEALRQLAGIDEKALDEDLGEGVKDLRSEVRDQIRPEISEEVAQLKEEGEWDQAVKRLTELLDLDPGLGLGYALLGLLMVEMGRAEEALEQVNRGLRLSDAEDRKVLTDARTVILDTICMSRMESVREAFRNRKYRQAKSCLRQIDDVCHDLPLFNVLDDYLERLSPSVIGKFFGRSPNLEKIEPQGPRETVNQLYYFLVGSEIHDAEEYVEDNELESAIDSIKTALTHCPRFPFANYFLAATTFRNLIWRVLTGDIPEDESFIDWCLSVLDQIQRAAQKAVANPDIAEDCRSLTDHSESLQNHLLEVKEKTEAIAEACRRLNSIMENASKLTSIAQLERIEGKLVSLRRDLTPLRRRVGDSFYVQAIDRLEEAIDSNLDGLRELKPKLTQVEIVVSHQNRLSAIVAMAKSGTYSDFLGRNRLIKDIEELRNKATADRRRVTDPDIRAKLEELINATEVALRSVRGIMF